ncbi:chloramphenicol acetyltransferase [uncultured Tenacibaculum sp.]|uniref:chloramphenicol acetyltransferase n=1 Tax=uncultured Tenacibaculum sp. TaxID=174713 RepID=UPI00262BACC1|nr:chloramphenicol acetyltransferase [uncultured Tenacibaculum sp.]
MKYLDIDSWNRKELFHHFRTLDDSTFALVANVDVTNTFKDAKEKKESFFVRYLHACLIAINSVENLKYRIEGDQIAIYETIQASATIAREDHTFGFSFIEFNESFADFNNNFQKEKKRIQETRDLFPPKYSLGCIHCSAIPWVHFSGHKEPFSGNKDDSVPQLAFGKIEEKKGRLMMPVAINVNHALVDGYHVGLFFEEFQNQLDKIN